MLVSGVGFILFPPISNSVGKSIANNEIAKFEQQINNIAEGSFEEALERDAVKKDLALRKASDFVKENAKVTEISAEEKEAKMKAEAEKASKKTKTEKAEGEEKPKTTRKKKTDTENAEAEGEEKPKTTRKKKTEAPKDGE